ncbi:hypothetical protein MGYG_04559 [Nannizzia gypsea CBS 118893]|uniref:Uncharacterized protein n=1 Tax=Arthroderma gypseum (strain ATCC MYA-4604 / CBS 118893) TaxID=535722 RepID=E4UTR4_ARTGP|nr:hypothetical protein MGYG_04559 [Nannizzia gypsea CBS 118893]EFR01557.1 hypothetical protein MGYG_04559 [Nannizzia gypsea CBS 118893]
MASSQDQGTQMPRLTENKTVSASARGRYTPGKAGNAARELTPSHLGRKWSDNEEAWLVVNSMKDITVPWLYANFPYPGRSQNSITGHLADMRLHNRLSRKWRHKTWDNEPPYSLREDIEIMQWHRAGGSIIARANYLCRDEELVEKVREAEEAARDALDARDEAWYDAKEEIPEESVDPSALRMMNRILFRTESDTIVKICDAISKSLANRDDFSLSSSEKEEGEIDAENEDANDEDADYEDAEDGDAGDEA